MDRRRFVLMTLGGTIATLRTAEAQPLERSVRMGYLAMSLAAGDPAPRNAFIQGLRELGYVEGRNLRIEYRDAQGKTERLGRLAQELVAQNVDLIVSSSGSLGVVASQQATKTIPIVFTSVGDPVAEGLVSSLARPGGNVTGFSLAIPELLNKSLELLRQAVPGATRVALLLNPDAVPERIRLERVKAADAVARTLGLKLQMVEARGPQDFDRAFAAMSTARAEALAILATPVFGAARVRLADLAMKHRLPSVSSLMEWVDAGGLMSYGPDLVHLFRRAANHVDKILKGAKPADLPVEQPTKFELVVNLKTAKVLGLTIPSSLLLRADQVIE